jgi:hypothetical protein
MVREGRVFISVSTDPDFGANYLVTAYEVGAQVTSGSSGTTIAVRAGHGFATNDKMLVVSEFPATTKYRTITGTGATSLTVGAVVVSAGDILVNLAQDTGVASPNYDGAGLTIYTDMDYATTATNNTVTCDVNGRYIYYHQGIATWELVRSTTAVPFALYQVGVVSTVQSPTVVPVLDNAVVRFDTTSGNLIQKSVVIIDDAGATSGITTLGISGAATFGGALAMNGALTGVSSITASGAITAASTTLTGAMNSATVVTTGTATIGGALILNAGVTGNITATGNITSGGQLAGLSVSQSISANTAFDGAGKLIINITNSANNNTGCTLVAPSVSGQILILRIVAVTGSIKVIESTTAILAGADWGTALALGAGDTLTLISFGSLWYELCRSDN